MAVSRGEVLGSLQDFYGEIEAGFNSVQTVTGDRVGADSEGGPIKVLSSTFGVQEPEEFRDDARQGLADYGTMEMMKEYVWSTEHRVVPIASGETWPELHPLLWAVFGNSSVSGGRLYSFDAANIQRPPCLQLTRAFNGKDDRLVVEQLNGAFVSQMTIRGQGGQPPLISFSGEAASFRRGVTTDVDSGTGAGVINFAAGENRGFGFDAGIRVEVGGDDNSGSGYPVSSVAADSIDTGSDDWSSLTSSDQVKPWVPDPTYHGTQIIGATQGSVTLASLSFPVTAFDITVDFAPDYRKDEYGTESIQGAVRTLARVTGNVTIRAREDANFFANYARQHPEISAVFNIGSTTGGSERLWVATCDQAKINPQQIQAPQNGLGRFTIPFMSLASADGEVDHFTLRAGTP